MGKGDKRSKRGKIRLGSYGNTRKRKKTKKHGASAVTAAPKKVAVKKPAKKVAKKA